MKALRCPKCGYPARAVRTQYGQRNSCCGLWSWGTKPLVDGATHEARMAAHAAFDPIWQSGRLSRSKAYKLLAQRLGIAKDDCHMSLMPAEVAARVPEIAAELLKEPGS